MSKGWFRFLWIRGQERAMAMIEMLVGIDPQDANMIVIIVDLHQKR